VLPLVTASGAGAAGRRAMGVVIFTGLSIGTLFTLFVVPAMYAFLAGRHAKSGEGAEASGRAPAITLTPTPLPQAGEGRK
jgi:multidrug efflux pump